MSDRGGDAVLGASLLALVVVVSSLWLAASVSAWSVGAPLGRPWSAGVSALLAHATDGTGPAEAWGNDPERFGPPVLYWSIAGGSVVSFAVAAVVGVSRFGTRARVVRGDRLGVEPGARTARRRELRSLLVTGPVEGRFGFAWWGRRLVAAPGDPGAGGRNEGGDRSSLMVFGTTRSGKTATVVPGIVEWDLPAVVSSVKADLMVATVERRLEVGEVFVFDPFGVAPEVDGAVRVGWSPVACSGSAAGAIAAARNLADAAAVDDVSSSGYWTDRAAALLWPLLFAASFSGRSMVDVNRWLATQDGVEPSSSEVDRILEHGLLRGGRVGADAERALEVFDAWRRLDDRPRSDQSATAQSLVSCWSDPRAAAASDRGLPSIDLGRIVSGRNTLYVVQPLGRGEQFAPMFGGLFGDLLRDQAYRLAQAAGCRIGPLLVVMDEAGNAPVRWLPEVASTCAGIGVQLVTIWQDRAQVDAQYGVRAQSLLNNHGTKLFFAGQSDPATLEYASMLCGEEEATSIGTSSDLGMLQGRRSMSAQPVAKRLVPPEVVRQMPTGTALLVHQNLPPAHVRGRRVWSDRQRRRPVPEPLVIDERISDALGRRVLRPE